MGTLNASSADYSFTALQQASTEGYDVFALQEGKFRSEIWSRPRPSSHEMFAAWVEEWNEAPAALAGEPLTAQESQAAALASHAVAAGPSGWRPEGLKHAPLAAFEDVTVWVNQVLLCNCVPDTWREAVQVLIPKDGIEADAAGSIPVDKLRPITPQCTIWLPCRCGGDAVFFVSWLWAKFCWGWLNFEILTPETREFASICRRVCRVHSTFSARIRSLLEDILLMLSLQLDCMHWGISGGFMLMDSFHRGVHPPLMGRGKAGSVSFLQGLAGVKKGPSCGDTRMKVFCSSGLATPFINVVVVFTLSGTLGGTSSGQALLPKIDVMLGFWLLISLILEGSKWFQPGTLKRIQRMREFLCGGACSIR